jgi:hypothetical protein
MMVPSRGDEPSREGAAQGLDQGREAENRIDL